MTTASLHSATMTAVLLTASGTPLHTASVDRPVAGAGQVLVRIRAAGLNPLDAKIRAGKAGHAQAQLPAVLGIDMAGVVEAIGDGVPVFNGRGGLELLDGLRAGCAGYILAPDLIDYAVNAYTAFRAGNEVSAEEIYRAMLPSAVAVMQGIEHLICYGKRLFAERAGLTVHDRAPAMRPTPFGEELVALHAKRLGSF